MHNFSNIEITEANDIWYEKNNCSFFLSEEKESVFDLQLVFDEKELGKELQGQLMDKEIESNYISSPNFTLLNLPFYAQLNEEEILQICLHVSEFFGGDENQEAFLDIRKIFLDNLDF